MSKETIILLGLGYLGLMTLILCLLAIAKSADEDAVTWEADQRHRDRAHGRDAA